MCRLVNICVDMFGHKFVHKLEEAASVMGGALTPDYRGKGRGQEGIRG